MQLEGLTIRGERAQRGVWVCGAGAFIVLKALAFKYRGMNKDAYVRRIQPLLQDEHCLQALAVLRKDFLSPDATGPRRVADFLTGGPEAREVNASDTLMPW